MPAAKTFTFPIYRDGSKTAQALKTDAGDKVTSASLVEAAAEDETEETPAS